MNFLIEDREQKLYNGYSPCSEGMGIDNRMTLSEEGLKTIANYEMCSGVIKSWGLGEYDEYGNLTGIYRNVNPDSNTVRKYLYLWILNEEVIMTTKKFIFMLFLLISSLFLFTGCIENDEFVNTSNSIDIENEKNGVDDIRSTNVNIDSNKTDTFVTANDNEEPHKEDKNNESNSIENDDFISVIKGTWSLEKITLVSEILMFPTEEEVDSPDLQDDTESYVGLELEIKDNYLRLDEKKYLNPEFRVDYMTLKEFNDSGEFILPDAYSFILDGNISINNSENYESLSEVPLKVYKIDFDEDYSMPISTQFVVLNDDTMFIGLWGKIILAKRIES